MADLVTLYDLQREGDDLRGEGIYDPTGEPVHTSDAGRVGVVRGALVDADGGHKVRYLVIDTAARLVIVPIGYVRIEDDGIYLDGLSRDSLASLHEYSDDETYTYDPDAAGERRLGGRGGTLEPMPDLAASAHGDLASTSSAATSSFDMFQTPQRLRLLEERLAVHKQRVHTGTVEVGKHVETHTEQIPVTLTHEEIVIERHPVSNPTPASGAQLGASNETIRVDLEAERADVRKQAFVTEEVTIGEREVSQTQTFTETVGREVLDVNRTGDVTVGSANVTNAGGQTGVAATGADRSLLERSGTVLDADSDGVDTRTDSH